MNIKWVISSLKFLGYISISQKSKIGYGSAVSKTQLRKNFTGVEPPNSLPGNCHNV